MDGEIVEDFIKFEQQYILRLPEDMAEELRQGLNTKPKKVKKNLKLKMDPETRLGFVTYNNKSVALKLVDLPTITESLKTVDNKFFFKTADIHQMMVAYTPEQNNNIVEYNIQNHKEFLSPHGFTPPLKNVKKNRFRKTLRNKNYFTNQLERELKRLLKMDHEAVSFSWELINESESFVKTELCETNNDSDAMEIIDEKDVFGDLSTSLSEEEIKELLQEYQEMQANGTLHKLSTKLHVVP